MSRRRIAFDVTAVALALLCSPSFGAGDDARRRPPPPPTEPIQSPVLAAGWHLISIPAQPRDPSPQEVFWDSNNLPIPISGNLVRFDAAKQRYVTYYDLKPRAFGECHTGEGYWLYLCEPTIIRYRGTEHIGPQLLECKGEGIEWCLIGHSFTAPLALADCQVVNRVTGEELPLARAARGQGWIHLPMFYYDHAVRRYETCGARPEDDDHSFRPWRGYWLESGRYVYIVLPPPHPAALGAAREYPARFDATPLTEARLALQAPAPAP